MMYKHKYLKYKKKYLESSKNMLGGAPHVDEYVVSEIETKLRQIPDHVLLYSLQLPPLLETMAINLYGPRGGMYVYEKTIETKRDLANLNVSIPTDVYVVTGDVSSLQLLNLSYKPNDENILQYFNVLTIDRGTLETRIRELVAGKSFNPNARIFVQRTSSVPGFYALTMYDVTTGIFNHYVAKTESSKIYPYLDNTGLRNDEYFSKFLSMRSINSPGGTFLAYKNYYTNMGIPPSNIHCVFNPDRIGNIRDEFRKLTPNSHLIIMGHCAPGDLIISSNPTLVCKNGDTINNDPLTARKIIPLLELVNKNPRTNKSLLVYFHVCQAQNVFMPNLISEMIHIRVPVKPIMIANSELVNDLRNRELGEIIHDITNNMTGKFSHINYWTAVLNTYISIPGFAFGLDETTLFKPRLMTDIIDDELAVI